jgi:hypothetical protein
MRARGPEWMGAGDFEDPIPSCPIVDQTSLVCHYGTDHPHTSSSSGIRRKTSTVGCDRVTPLWSACRITGQEKT